YEINHLEFVKGRNATIGLCRSGIQPQPSTINVNYWTLGDTFLANVITAFDFDNLQIGFASTVPGSGTPSNGNDNGNYSKKS
ncbi:6377_t:CDS:2, partial [Cetraspora pellucida]